MNTKTIVSSVLLLFVLISVAYLAFGNRNVEQSTVDKATGHHVVAYYFHGDKRCPTCEKLETYAQEAIQAGFAERLADSGLTWTTVNYDRPEHAHFIDDYQLSYQMVILVEYQDGTQIAHHKLEKIWDLIGDKEVYQNYVTTEVQSFLDNQL